YALLPPEDVERERPGAVESAEPSAAGDQDQAAGRARQEGADLVLAGGVVEEDEHAPFGESRSPQRRALLQRCRDLLRVLTNLPQQNLQAVGGIDRRAVRVVRVKIEVQASVRVPVGE